MKTSSNQTNQIKIQRYDITVVGGVDLVGMTAVDFDARPNDQGEWMKVSEVESLMDANCADYMAHLDEKEKRIEVLENVIESFDTHDVNGSLARLREALGTSAPPAHSAAELPSSPEEKCVECGLKSDEHDDPEEFKAMKDDAPQFDETWINSWAFNILSDAGIDASTFADEWLGEKRATVADKLKRFAEALKNTGWADQLQTAKAGK